jgi:hypothetical protein
MLRFEQEMDSKSRTILQDDKRIGFLQWHTGTVRVVFHGSVTLSLSDLKHLQVRVEHGTPAQ